MKRNTSKTIKGVLSVSASGTGYLKVENEKKDVLIESVDLGLGLHGDSVEIILDKNKNTGRVLNVISRFKNRFSGVLEKHKKRYVFVADDIKMYTNIEIPEKDLNGAKVGQKVYVEMLNWEDKNTLPIGKVIKVLGSPGENNTEMHAIAIERGFDNTFNTSVEKEAHKIEQNGIKKEDEKNRKDFRKTLTFTIDPYDAKDFDDAISFKILKNNLYEVGIHIADVSHYVKIGSEIDREAQKRGTSVYLVDRTIPMLPEVLSNNLCSLVPNQDRLTMSAVFEIDENGHITKEWYGKSIIHSQKRFTYEEAENVIQNKNLKLHKELSILNNIAKKLNEERFTNGAISLEQEEIKFVLDKKGYPIKIIKKTRGDSNKMIEEFMLLANRKIAETIEKGTKKGIFVYRIHENPSKEKMEDLIYFLKSLGYEPKIENGIIPNKEINKLLKDLTGKHEGDTIQRAIVRSMAKAIYSTKNVGHYGLAFLHYAHFTSPIRRYPDIVVHRLLENFLNGKKIDKDKLHIYEKISNKASEREKYAADAERASVKYKQVEYMSLHKDEIFEGVISGVTEWGIYIEETSSKSEGLVRLRDLTDDYYIFDEKKLELTGTKNKKKYRFGDRVKIKVKEVDLERKTIDYKLI